jgi:hypothetical protein
MLKSRAYELRLPADWPPAAVTVNGKPVAQAQAGKPGGWSYEGNTLTTVIPTASLSTAAGVTIEVHRAAGMTARRNELDDFAGTMARLRGAYDELQKLGPAANTPEAVIVAMQTGDRISYHPEHTADEVAQLRAAVTEAQDSVSALDADFARLLDASTNHVGGASYVHVDVAFEKQRRWDSLHRAEAMLGDAGK